MNHIKCEGKKLQEMTSSSDQYRQFNWFEVWLSAGGDSDVSRSSVGTEVLPLLQLFNMARSQELEIQISFWKTYEFQILKIVVS